ncbi:hypothetical protein GO730_38075 [Spirosoma sp. HMF3257]|uniref:Uncharacterized protein n=1 Tax=Spirosoma telluris TaxID=2183553 RepID=A0A327NDZ2_9BACT|nr:hypothetical protein [Spirosoma telluris]MVM42129.1 hypothetical protein [Spirosoma telluris]RAI73045.1 hypothetical protein HMF3257_37205 [Spirosoma telluris]RAI73175.1 hypothetical protein HMF3257_37975 [Spirosoma telluris]
MRQTIIYLFLSLVLMQNSSRLGVLIWFDVNQSAIAQTRCENRFQPKARCNGHCVLAKRLKAIDQREKQSAQQAQLPEIQWFISAFQLVYTFNTTDNLSNTKVGMSADYARYPAPEHPIYHPPNC